jgi:hypothetical protein
VFCSPKLLLLLLLNPISLLAWAGAPPPTLPYLSLKCGLSVSTQHISQR